jgi:hypothetical protein
MGAQQGRSLCALLILSALLHLQAAGQAFTWTPVATDLPPSVRVYAGTAAGPINAFYAEIDYGDTLVDALALRSTTSGKKETVSSFAQKSKAYVAVNGGFFDGTSGASYSLVVSDGKLIEKQWPAVSRTAGTYPLVRANFGVMSDRSLQTAWIYHFSNELSGVYRFLQPLPHTQTTIAPAPQQADGSPWTGVLQAVGGGPNLVSNGSLNVTYDQEVMFGSGVGRDNGDPRTAIGYTIDGKIILFVVDGRGASIGMSLPQVAQTMINLGCVEAINLDGGGSSTFYAGGQRRNTPSDGSERLVASAFAIVPVPSYDNQMDTDASGYSESGTGWLSTIDPGYFGTQTTRIVQAGSGDKAATFRFQVPAEAEYEISAWWTATVIRAINTPFIVYSKGRVDTVRLNQTTNGGKWNLLGTFTLPAGLDSVMISNDAVGNSSPAFIAVDGLRVVSYDRSVAVGISPAAEFPTTFELGQNYPNPFNPRTTIRYRLSESGHVSLQIYDILGRGVETLVDQMQQPGEYHIRWDATGRASGMYLCRLSQNGSAQVRTMLVLK